MGAIDKLIEELLEDTNDDKLLSNANDHKFIKNKDFVVTNEGVSTNSRFDCHRTNPTNTNGKQLWENADGRKYHVLHLCTSKNPSSTSVVKLLASLGGKPPVLAIVMVEEGAKPTATDLRIAFSASYTKTGTPEKSWIAAYS